jgi:hypothetical protein
MAARADCRESREDFAARAGVGLPLVEGAEDGSYPVWELPYAEFTALADAVSVLSPSLRAVFETAAACDLLLTCVMRGDQAFSTDVLADDDTRHLAAGLLRWAVKCGGCICPACGWCPCEAGPAGYGHRGQLLGDVDLAVLRGKASALARSGSPDAWVGAELLAVFGGAR